MGGFCGVISEQDCVSDLFFGTDYHFHLGTRRAGLAVYSKENGFDKIATGHYAKTVIDANGNCILKTATDKNKDQSYFLASLTQHQLAHTRFPLGSFTKNQIRQIAEEQGFLTAKKRDSQDICFIPDGDYYSFIKKYTGEHFPSGDFLDRNGRIVGKHCGAVAYTIGQRKGTGIALGTPAYVSRIDALHNAVYVTQDEQTLFTGTLTAERVNWQLAAAPSPGTTFRARVQIRYRSGAVPAEVSVTEDGHTCTVNFDSPVRAVTPGQAAVFYCEDDDRILGGGFIR